MGKVLKPLLGVALIAVGGIGLAGIAAAAAVGATTAATTVLAFQAATAIGAATLLGSIKGKQGSTLTPFDPKSINVQSDTPRKALFGRGLFPLDLRYAEPSGTNQEYIDYIFVLAAHKSQSVDEIWIEDQLAWTSAGGAQGVYVGYLTVEVILEAGASAYHTVNGGAKWGAGQRLTGCTTMKVRVKRSANSKTSDSPFANGIAGRWSVIGQGMPLYDPARDSTVVGGSGPQRANDCTTWAYTASSVERGQNHALQLLAWHLGWRINGVVSVGCGMPANCIDMVAFAQAAARCDEAVALAGGGTQRRYEGGRGFTDGDGPDAVSNALCAAMNAKLTDDGGRIGLRVAVNDLTAVMTLTDDDYQSGYNWQPAPPVDEQYTIVRSRYTVPGSPSLFNLSDAPSVTVPRASVAPRALTLDLTAVQDIRRAERIAKQVAQRSLYQGTFSVRVGIRGWRLRRNMIIAVDCQSRGWSGKLMRVRSLSFNMDGTVDMVAREENAAVYQWDAAETGSVSPVVPVTYDPRNAPWISAVAAAATTATWPGIEPGNGKPDDNATQAENLVVNSDLTVDASGWTSGGGVSRATGSAGAPAVGVFAFPTHSSGTAPNVKSNRFPVLAGERIFASVKTYRAGAVSATYYLAFLNWYDASDTQIGNYSWTALPGAAGAWELFSSSGVAPTGTAYARFAVQGEGMTGATQVAAARVARTQAGADITSAAQVAVAVPSLQSYAADYTGAIIGSLSPITVLVTRGGSSIRLADGTSYAITVNGGATASIDNTNGSGTKGNITLSAFTGTYATIDVVVTVDGVAQPKQTIVLQKIVAIPPAGGGTGAKIAYDTALTATASTSYVTVTDPMTVTVASGESLYCTGSIDYEVSGTTVATRTATFKWQRSPAGAGTWTDIGSAITGSTAQSGYFTSGEWIDPAMGQATIAATAATPGAGSYDIRLQALVSASGRTITFSGTATVEAKA